MPVLSSTMVVLEDPGGRGEFGQVLDRDHLVDAALLDGRARWQAVGQGVDRRNSGWNRRSDPRHSRALGR